MGSEPFYITFPSADSIIDTTITDESMLGINNDKKSRSFTDVTRRAIGVLKSTVRG